MNGQFNGRGEVSDLLFSGWGRKKSAFHHWKGQRQKEKHRAELGHRLCIAGPNLVKY